MQGRLICHPVAQDLVSPLALTATPGTSKQPGCPPPTVERLPDCGTANAARLECLGEPRPCAVAAFGNQRILRFAVASRWSRYVADAEERAFLSRRGASTSGSQMLKIGHVATAVAAALWLAPGSTGQDMPTDDEVRAFLSRPEASQILAELDKGYEKWVESTLRLVASAETRLNSALRQLQADIAGMRRLFVRGPGGVTMQRYADTMVINLQWLKGISECDSIAATAHELSHDRNDFARALLIAFNKALSDKTKQELYEKLEEDADQRAAILLSARGFDPAILVAALAKSLTATTWRSKLRLQNISAFIQRGSLRMDQPSATCNGTIPK